jgi:hypothetical protein
MLAKQGGLSAFGMKQRRNPVPACRTLVSF